MVLPILPSFGQEIVSISGFRVRCPKQVDVNPDVAKKTPL
jgi:hypothetical protein